MLLYRLIPDHWGYLFEKECLAKDGLTTEDLFYDLGYLNVSEHDIYLPITIDSNLMPKTWHDNTGKGIFFFPSPWDCVQNFSSIDTRCTSFSNFGVRICEYDVPDDIIANSWQGEGYYGGLPVPEIKVPLELILSNPETNITPELESSLKKVSELQAEESFEKLIPPIRELYHHHGYELTDENIEEIRTEDFSLEFQEEINEIRFPNSGIFQKSPFITGRRFYITITDYHNAYRDNGFDYESLIPLSNDILTEENLALYKNRFQNR